MKFDSYFLSQADGVDTAISFSGDNYDTFFGEASSCGATVTGTRGLGGDGVEPFFDLTNHDVQTTEVSYNYSVKIISPFNKGLQVRKWVQNVKFYTYASIRSSLLEDFKDLIHEEEFCTCFGFIQPGHGAKGRQVVIERDEDLPSMYDVHKGRKQILLWIKVKRKHPSRDIPDKTAKKPCGETGSNYQGHLKHLTVVEQIVADLEEQHKDMYTPEQIRAWAHMIHMKKHSSYNEPPLKPFFKNGKSKQILVPPPTSTLSPAKMAWPSREGSYYSVRI